MLRFWVPISLVAAVGIIVSTAVGIRFYHQEIASERNLLDRSVDAHAGLIQERLDEREVLARMAAAKVLVRFSSSGRCSAACWAAAQASGKRVQ